MPTRACGPNPGDRRSYSDDFASGEMFAEYIDWRAEHPSDDIMTQLLQAEFEDETGTRAELTRDEILTYVNVDRRRGQRDHHSPDRLGRARCWPTTPTSGASSSDDPSLIPNAIEELLRYEPPAPHVGRYVARDVELHGQVVPAGSAVLFLVGSANRDDRRFPDGDRFDIHREIGQHLAFGYGAHYLPGRGARPARGTRRVGGAAEAVPRVGRRLATAPGSRSTSTVRGWETLPVVVP